MEPASSESPELPERIDPRGRVRGLDHITIPVRDLEVAERFYVGLLGAELVLRVDEAFLSRAGGPLPPERRADLSGPNSPLHLGVQLGAGPRIDLFLNPGWTPAPLYPHPHWAFGVATADLLPLQARLHQAGVPTDGPRRLGPPGQASVYFKDPFGNLLEFMTTGFPEPLPIGGPDLSRLSHSFAG